MKELFQLEEISGLLWKQTYFYLKAAFSFNWNFRDLPPSHVSPHVWTYEWMKKNWRRKLEMF